MFPDLEKLRGDRNTGDLASLQGREFDAVIDTSGYVPHTSRPSPRVVRRVCWGRPPSSRRSPCAPDFGTAAKDLDQDAPLATATAEQIDKAKTISRVAALYGAMKALCRARRGRGDAGARRRSARRVDRRAGRRLRPLHLWPVRMDRGGEVLCAAINARACRFVDVRDLGDWVSASAPSRRWPAP